MVPLSESSLQKSLPMTLNHHPVLNRLIMQNICFFEDLLQFRNLWKQTEPLLVSSRNPELIQFCREQDFETLLKLTTKDYPYVYLGITNRSLLYTSMNLSDLILLSLEMYQDIFYFRRFFISLIEMMNKDSEQKIKYQEGSISQFNQENSNKLNLLLSRNYNDCKLLIERFNYSNSRELESEMTTLTKQVTNLDHQMISILQAKSFQQRLLDDPKFRNHFIENLFRDRDFFKHGKYLPKMSPSETTSELSSFINNIEQKSNIVNNDHNEDHQNFKKKLKTNKSDESLNLVCNLCDEDKSHFSLQSLCDHIKTKHIDFHEWTCLTCNKTHSEHSLLAQHLYFSHRLMVDLAEPSFICGRCRRSSESKSKSSTNVFSSLKEFCEHLAKQHKNTTQCPNCPKNYPQKYGLRAHLQRSDCCLKQPKQLPKCPFDECRYYGVFGSYLTKIHILSKHVCQD